MNPPHHPVGLECADVRHLGSERGGVPDAPARLGAKSSPPASRSERGPRREARHGLVHRSEDKKEIPCRSNLRSVRTPRCACPITAPARERGGIVSPVAEFPPDSRRSARFAISPRQQEVRSIRDVTQGCLQRRLERLAEYTRQSRDDDRLEDGALGRPNAPQTLHPPLRALVLFGQSWLAAHRTPA